MLQNMNDLGMGRKESMDNIIVEEAESLIQRFREYADKNIPVKIKGFFLRTVNSVVWRITTGTRTTQDKEVLELTDKMVEYLKSINPGSLFCLLQLYSSTFTRLCLFLNVPQTLVKRSRGFINLLTKQIGEQTADSNGNFIERYLAEIQKNNDKPDSSFHGADGQKHLLGQMKDIFIAGR